MQQMKNTVESSMQAFMDKNQDCNMSHPPPPAHPPIPISPPIPSHPDPPDDFPPSHHRSHRRSRSHRHRSGSRKPDKRPISIPRSPRRPKSKRRAHRSSRPRSSSRRRCSTSRHASRRPSRAASITLRSASPRHREVQHRGDDDHPLHEPSHLPANLQPATWEHHPQQSSHTANTQSNYYHYDQQTTNKWKSWANGKITPSPPTHPTHLVGLATQNQHSATTANTTPPPNHSQHSPPITAPPTINHADLHTDQVQSNLVVPPPSLQDVLPSTSKMAREMNGLDI